MRAVVNVVAMAVLVNAFAGCGDTPQVGLRTDVGIERTPRQWVQDAESLVNELERLNWGPYKDVHSGDTLTWDEVLRGDKSISLYAIMFPADRKIARLTWCLWLTTGRPPFEDLDQHGVPTLSQLVANYRKFLRDNSQLTESEAQRQGLWAAVELLQGKYWQQAVEYLALKLGVGGLVERRTRDLFSPSRVLPYPQRSELYASYRTWLKEHCSRFSWNAEAGKFRPIDHDIDESRLLAAQRGIYILYLEQALKQKN